MRTILDVGGGSGKTACKLMEEGFAVDVVSPGVFLTQYARELMRGRGHIYASKFEEVQTSARYDLVLFSESFQYIPLQDSLRKAESLLNPGGFVMICDFFKKKAEGKSMLGGGHDFEAWENTLAQSPFRALVEKDITENTAPTIDLVDQFSQQVLRPVMHAGTALAEQRFPMVLKIVRYFYRKKLEKMQAKHFSGERTGEKFKHFKKYMFYLLQLA
ncbi:MAG: class I SAM-dependent methyltransferase [Microscillaceae bacterium]|nr:class I SAM-dependent methyltransferase [Microscillaceae bacterium]